MAWRGAPAVPCAAQLVCVLVALCSEVALSAAGGSAAHGDSAAGPLGRRFLQAVAEPHTELQHGADSAHSLYRQQLLHAAYLAPSSSGSGAHGRSLLQDEAPGGASTGKRQVCLNTCNKAKNGICEDGRKPKDPKTANPTRMVYCDLGTDCEDCGPWETSSDKLPWEESGKPGPIALLMSKDVQVRVRDSALPGIFSFGFAYTDPQKEFGVSSDMEHSAMVENSITQQFFKIFDGVCVGPDGKRRLFVDVGANFGWYSVMAAQMGCRVIAFEPVPHFRALFTYSTYLNDLQGLTDIKAEVVNDNHGGTVRFVVPARGIWGTAGIDGANIDPAIESSKEELQLGSVSLDETIKEEVLLLKVDVEGFECSVMKGAKRLMKEDKVQNIIMEYSPGVPERMRNHEMILATASMVKDMLDVQFRIGHIAWGHVPAEGVSEVVHDNIKYDLHDAKLLEANKLGCPPAEELKGFPLWVHCGGALPEDVSPRSLRSEIGHNTNIWATKNGTVLKFNGVVGIIKPQEPADTFYSTAENGKWGMGWRPCPDLPAEVQIRHRCRCTKEPECGDQGRAAEQAAKAGHIATNYIL